MFHLLVILTYLLEAGAVIVASSGETDNKESIRLAHNLSTTVAPSTTVNWSLIDNSEACRQYESYYTFRVIVNVFLVAPMCVCGFIGNALSIMVLREDNVNNTVSFLLQALAVADNAYLLTCFFFQTIQTISECTVWFPSLLYIYPYMEPYVWPCASIAQTSAVWLVMCVTVDRLVS